MRCHATHLSLSHSTALPLGAMALSLIVIRGAERQKTGLVLIDKLVDAGGRTAAAARLLLGRVQRRKAIP